MILAIIVVVAGAAALHLRSPPENLPATAKDAVTAGRALDRPESRQWAWMLAACQRGYDCENSTWMEFGCRFDPLCAQDTNAVDFIRRITDLDLPEIESRAKTINANFDAEAWDALERELKN